MNSLFRIVLLSAGFLVCAAAQSNDRKEPASKSDYHVQLSIFEGVPPAPLKPVKQKPADAPEAKTQSESAPQAATPPPPPPPPPAEPTPTVARAIGPEIPLKNITAADFARVEIGITERELFERLGPAESRVSIPDDDGHMRTTCQYWSNGKPIGTIVLDNGRVATVNAAKARY